MPPGTDTHAVPTNNDEFRTPSDCDSPIKRQASFESMKTVGVCCLFHLEGLATGNDSLELKIPKRLCDQYTTTDNRGEWRYD